MYLIFRRLLNSYCAFFQFASLQIKSLSETASIFLFSRNFKMSGDRCTDRPLFGGAITAAFPTRFQDVSAIRQVPDHQEVYVDPSRDESFVFELLDFKHDVCDVESASWFLQDLALESEAQGIVVHEQSSVFEASDLTFRGSPAIITTAVGEMAISKGRQGREAQNLVKVYLANIRLKVVETDVLITGYEPLFINPLSESAAAVGAGLPVSAAQSGCMPMDELFGSVVSSFKVHDWSLFGGAA